MDYLISKCCNAFTINRGTRLECTACGNEVTALETGDDILIGVQFTSNVDMLSGTGAGLSTAKRMATDPTCPIVEDKVCSKCNSPCRYINKGDGPIFVCSNGKCREIL